jgi:2-phosphosulfolactate phosphatase
MADPFAQSAYAVRFDWGPTAASHLSGSGGHAVVVDVLSFTTTVAVAVERGIEVYPYRWRDETASEYAAARGAELAVGRSESGRSGGVSLSPASIARAEGVERLVLPSPNGSTIAHLLGGGGATVIAGALRNAGAVAGWVAERLADAPEQGVVVVAAGERWPDGSLRPAVEDLWGAGAIISALTRSGLTELSPEARAAAAAYEAVDDLRANLLSCSSGRELAAGGFTEDVLIAAAVDASRAVPVLHKGCFRDARGQVHVA